MKKKSSIEKTSKNETNDTTMDIKGADFAKIWFLRVFHTLCMFVGAYAIIIFSVVNIPTVIPVVLGGLGFSVTASMSSAEYIVAFCAGIFLTLWMVIIDYLIIKGAWRLYKKNIAKTIKKNKNNEIIC